MNKKLNLFRERERDLDDEKWVFYSGKEGSERETDPIAADGGEDVEVAGVDEVENDGVEGTLAFLEPVSNSVIALLRRGERAHHWFAP